MPIADTQEDISAQEGLARRQRPRRHPGINSAPPQASKGFKRAEIILIGIGLCLCFFVILYNKVFLYDIASYLYGLIEICTSWFDSIQPSTPLPVVLLPTAAVVAFIIGIIAAGRNMPRPARALLMCALFYLHTVYLAFRVFNTLNLGGFLSSFVSIGLLFFEVMSYICLCTVYLQLAWPTDRVREADTFSRAVLLGEYTPSVDIFITTYNEPVDMLRRTVIGCQAMEYPNKRVYICDDKSRAPMRRLAEELGCHYICREHNIHAKAGNINNALAQTDGELVAIFDADCIPTKKFLAKTVGFFRRLGVGMVIASQHFYNRETDFKNMSVETVLSVDQSTFFSQVQAGRDTFNAMLCFGTGFVVGRDALKHIGGVPTETLSEDWATTIKLQAAGYKTYFINEPLTAGAAAESIGEFVQQRLRWAKGTIQALYSSTNPLKVKGLNFIQRCIHSYGIFYYLMFPLQLIVLLFPLLYFFFDIVPIKTNLNQMTFFFIPFFLLLQVVFSWVSNNYSSFLSSHVYEYFLYIPISGALIRLLRDPQYKIFRVTRKGISRKGITFEKSVAWPLIITLALYVAALLYGIYDARWRASGDVFILMTIWCIFRIIVLWTTLQVVINIPQERNTVRFKHNLACSILYNQEVSSARTVDISDEGIQVELNTASKAWLAGGIVNLDIPEIGIYDMPAHIRRFGGCKYLALEYDGITLAQKRQLVSFLYCADGQWKDINMTPLQALIIMLKSIFRIYPAESLRRYPL